MKRHSIPSTQIAFWGIALVVVVWLAASAAFEAHLGWPGSDVQWAKRMVGWVAEIWLARALIVGARRSYAASVRSL